MKRSNCNFYDEAAFTSDEIFETSEPFITQSSDFVDGVGYDMTDSLVEPPQFPNQCIYASSAGSVDQYFFRKYRECSLRMDAGDTRYFCADISCDVIINATVHNKLWPVPLLTQEKVDQAMRDDKEAALREYKNIFTSEGGDGQIIKRADIIRNSVIRPPKLFNNDGGKWGLFYDPARSKDNSVILCVEYYQDPKKKNVIKLIDIEKRDKTPMTTPNQVKELKRTILTYNGEGYADYENILRIGVDAGSGGAGVQTTDFLWEDWEGEDGNMHRGLIDKEYSPEAVRLYPNAISNKLILIQPAKYKVEMYRSAIEMIDLNLVEWPAEYDNRGYLTLTYEIDTNTGIKTIRDRDPSEKEYNELLKKGIEIVREKYTLTRDEEIALKQIDAMKTELVNIYRFKQSNGGDRFDLAPSVSNKLHDDRAYVFVMACHFLQQLRREPLITRKKQSYQIIDMLPVTPRKQINKIFG